MEYVQTQALAGLWEKLSYSASQVHGSAKALGRVAQSNATDPQCSCRVVGHKSDDPLHRRGQAASGRSHGVILAETHTRKAAETATAGQAEPSLLLLSARLAIAFAKGSKLGQLGRALLEVAGLRLISASAVELL